MSDYSSIVEREMERIAPPNYSLVDVRRRRDRRQRNKRIVSAIAAFVISTAALGFLFKMFGSGERQPATRPITPSNVSDLRLLGTGPIESFAVSDGLVYVANGETNQLEAYPASCYGVRTSCEPTWVAHLDTADSFLIEAGGGNVYVLADSLYAFSASCGIGGATCRPTWVGTIEGRGLRGRPELGGDTIYVPGPHRLYAFPTSCTGRCHPVWVSSKLPVGSPDDGAYPVISGDTVFVPSAAGGQIIAFPAHCAKAGSVCPPSGTWSVPGGGGVPVIADGEIFISSGGQLWVYPQSCAVGRRCQPLWSAPYGGSVAAANGKVFVDTFGVVRAFPARCDVPPCQPLWEAHGLPTGPSPAGGGMVAANGLLFIADDTAPRNDSFGRGGIYALPTTCGSGDAECKPAWTWGTAEHVAIGSFIVTDGRVYADGQVFGIEPGAGAPPLGVGTSGRSHTGTFAFYVFTALALLLVLLVVARRRRMSG